ncbi:MAG: hypothetical protein KGH61_00050 [Candidatus Micrarchaeota archaeon]|nr:hypothetical protein [Candidatus Micrarchaeota archaeon]MDE1847328.1 hypothetical protein [Candidatus Micrarchaeota archaeon]MDE1863943.1 hypothetical protein [Candidatus Micrarchaeota archaeon]
MGKGLERTNQDIRRLAAQYLELRRPIRSDVAKEIYKQLISLYNHKENLLETAKRK